MQISGPRTEVTNIYIYPHSLDSGGLLTLLLGRKGVAPAESQADLLSVLSVSVIMSILQMREPRQAKVSSLAKVSERSTRRTQI